MTDLPTAASPAQCCQAQPQNAAAPSRPSPAALAGPRNDLQRELMQQLTDVGQRLEGLDQFAGPAIAAPLRRSIDTARETVWSLNALLARALAELSNHYAQAELWRGTATAMEDIAIGDCIIDVEDLTVAGELRAVQAVVDDRARARDLAVQLEQDNARLTGAAVELAGARAYAAELEARIATWVTMGKLSKEAARNARRAAGRNAEAATGQATADAVAAAAHAELEG